MTEVTASVEIPVPPSVVWAVLTDFEAYPRWNTLLAVTGEVGVGETLAVRLSTPGLPTVRFAPEVTAVDPERALHWRAMLFGIDAEHAFLLEPTEAGTRFVQHEQFRGRVAGPVVGRLERRIRRGFEQMNVGLRRRAVEVHEDRSVVHTSDCSPE